MKNKQKHHMYTILIMVVFLFTISSTVPVRKNLYLSDNYPPTYDLTAEDIVARICEYTGVEWLEETVDRFKAGRSDEIITGVATTFLATYDVLKRAVDQNCNFIITHEPTFYNHLDNTEPLQDDPVQDMKIKFLEEHNLVVWRFHDHIHMMTPDGIIKGMVKGLGWEKYLVDGKENIFVLPEMSLQQLATLLKDHYGVSTIRVIGDPELRCTKIGLSVGAPGSMSQINLLQRDDVEVLIAGESREWETVEYVRDAVDAGMRKAIILLGHAVSEEDGMRYLVDELQEVIPEVPVKFIPAGNPFWNPE